MNSLLKEAIERNRVATVAKLLAQNPQWANLVDRGDNPPLFLAVSTERRSPACVEALLKAGADVNARVGQSSIFHWMAGDWCYEADAEDTCQIIALLVRAGADLEAKNQYGFTPLMVAIVECNMLALHEFLALGADPNAIVPTEGTTAFHQGQSLLSLAWFSPFAAEVIQELLAAGADVDLRDAYGRTALDYWQGNPFTLDADEQYRQQYAEKDVKAVTAIALLRPRPQL